MILSYLRKADKIIFSGTRQAGKEAWLFLLKTRAGRQGKETGWHEVESQLSAWAGIKVKACSPKIHK